MTTRALVVGSLVMDLAFHVPKRPDPGEVVIADEFGHFRGGKGYNQAVALARLGAEVTMVGAVGADAYGDAFLTALRREGIDAGRVIQIRGASTAVAVPLITPDGDVGFVQYQGANRHLAPAHCADLPDCDVLLLQGEIDPATSQTAARVIRGRGGIVLLNPAPARDITDELVATATVVSPNRPEAEALVARRGHQSATVDDDGAGYARALATGERAAVVTLGARGAAWADGTSSGVVAPPRIQAVDATAAGDSFNAALAVSLAEGADYEEAVRFACAAGAHAATVRGAEPSLPTRRDVETLMTASG